MTVISIVISLDLEFLIYLSYGVYPPVFPSQRGIFPGKKMKTAGKAVF
jgi:hypothetical protein